MPERANYQQRPLVADAREHTADVLAGRSIVVVTWFRQSASFLNDGNRA
jgi:hypothetical protein